MLKLRPRTKQPTLVLMFKRPRLFHGKQRLARQIGPTAALKFAELFLDCALEDAAAWPGQVVLAPDSADDTMYAARLLNRDVKVMPQSDGPLAERLWRLDNELRRRGHEGIFFIGSDAPVLSADYYDRARNALECADFVLGPAEDGGITIMGAKAPWADFRDLPWETSDLFQAFSQQLHNEADPFVTLQHRYDVDDRDDLEHLYNDLSRDRRPARQALAAELYQFFNTKEVQYA